MRRPPDLSTRQTANIPRGIIPSFNERQSTVGKISTNGGVIFTPNCACTVLFIMAQFNAATIVQLCVNGNPYGMPFPIQAGQFIRFAGRQMVNNETLSFLLTPATTVNFEVVWVKGTFPEFLFHDSEVMGLSTSGVSGTQNTNLIQVLGTAVDVNTGNATAGTQRVVLASNQPVIPVNNSQVSGTAVDVNSGAATAGTQRVILATNQPVIPVTASITPSSVTVANPAAGAEISATLATTGFLQSINFRLVTSATVANRTPNLQITDTAGNRIYAVQVLFAITASQTQDFYAANGLPYSPIANPNGQIFLPLPNLAVLSGWHILTNSSGLQAADQFSLIEYTLRV